MVKSFLTSFIILCHQSRGNSQACFVYSAYVLFWFFQHLGYSILINKQNDQLYPAFCTRLTSTGILVFWSRANCDFHPMQEASCFTHIGENVPLFVPESFSAQGFWNPFESLVTEMLSEDDVYILGPTLTY